MYPNTVNQSEYGLYFIMHIFLTCNLMTKVKLDAGGVAEQNCFSV